jgi:hypothetical protein
MEDAYEKAKNEYLGEAPDGKEGIFLDDDQEIELSDSDSEEEVNTDKNKAPAKRGLFSRFTSSIKNLTGNMVKEKNFPKSYRF